MKNLRREQFCDWDRMPVVINVDTVCVLLNCCALTVHKKIKDGTFKAGKLGKAWCIDRDSVREFVIGCTAVSG